MHIDLSLQIVLYSVGMLKSTGVEAKMIPFAVIGTNAVLVLATGVGVSNL